MKVSVCMITYNHEPYIDEAILSIISQKGINHDDFELVIGEDLSTDNTHERCINYLKEYPKIIRVLPRKKNLGMLNNFLETIKDCKGEYIALCEGDDFWTNTYKLYKQIKILDNNKDCSFCFHKGDVLKNNTIYDTTDYKKKKYYFNDFAKDGCFIKTLSVVFRRKDLDISFFEKEEYKELSGADMLLYLVLTLKGKYAYCINETMGVYRHHSGGVWNSLSNSSRLDKMENDAIIYKKILPLKRKQKSNLNFQFKKVLCARFVYQNKTSPIIIRKLLNGFINRIVFIFGPGFISNAIIDLYYWLRKKSQFK